MPKKVLIAEDDRSIAVLLQRLVEECQVQAEVANNGQEALSRIRSAPPDLLLLDLIMPIMSGEEVLDQLQADEALRQIPVVIISTKAEMEELPYRYPLLPKPFSPAQVRQTVKQALGLD